MNTRTFEHGEDGRITGQVTMFNGKPYVSLVFEYDDAGAPVKMSMFNTKGDLQNGYELAYDDKVNPFAGMVFANVTSLILGHPVGAYKHNLVSRKKFNARTTEPAPAQVTTYTYNDAGYPLTIAQADKPDEVPASLEYDCQ